VTQPQIEFPPPMPVEIQKRIWDAFESTKLSDCQYVVLCQVIDRPGRCKAIKISEMQWQWELGEWFIYSDREIKGAVKSLVEDFEIPIGSSRAKPAGYYLIVTPEDAEAAVKPLLAEIRSLAHRCRILSPKSQYVRHLLGQLSVEENQ
jgi:hypothetical protein